MILKRFWSYKHARNDSTIEVNMLTMNTEKHESNVIDSTKMQWSSELTLKGELIIIKNQHNKIMALVDGSRWFGKVQLLQADCLNYEWAKSQAMRVYEIVSNERNQHNRG